MNLIRLILLAVLFWLAFSVIKRWLQQHSARQRTPSASAKAVAQERMVKCVYCGLHVPESEAVRSNGLNYCSIEHRDAHSPRG